jgi:hypothetical protein
VEPELQIKQKWQDFTLPAVVLFSPSLSLRYRVAWEYCTEKANKGFNKRFFDKAVNFLGQENVQIIVDRFVPLAGMIFVCGCPINNVVVGNSTLYCEDGKITAIRVELPSNEVDYTSFMDLTFHEVLVCLGFDKSDIIKYKYGKYTDFPKELVAAVNCSYNLNL